MLAVHFVQTAGIPAKFRIDFFSPQDLAIVLVERTHGPVGEVCDEDETSGSDDRHRRGFLEGIIVEGEDVVGDLPAGQLVAILVGREQLLDGHADLLLELLAKVPAHEADRGVHRMVAGAAIDAPPLDLHVEHPVEQLEIAAGMHAEIADEVLLRVALVVAVIAGVEDQDVALLDLDARRGDHVRGDDVPVADLVGDVDDHALVDQEFERVGGHVAVAAVGGVERAVEMGADMQRGVDALRDDAHRLQVLGVVHLVAGVADPAWRMDAHCGATGRSSSCCSSPATQACHSAAWATAPRSPPFGEKIGGVHHQAEMQRHHLQRRLFHLFVGSPDEIAQHDDAVIEVAGVEGGIEDAAVGEAAVEHHRAHIHVAEEEIEVGRIEGRQPLLGVDDEVLRLDAGHEVGPTRSLRSHARPRWGCRRHRAEMSGARRT